MGTLTKVRFVKSWQLYRVGDVIQPNGTLRSELLRRGIVVLVEEAPAAVVRSARRRRAYL